VKRLTTGFTRLAIIALAGMALLSSTPASAEERVSDRIAKLEQELAELKELLKAQQASQQAAQQEAQQQLDARLLAAQQEQEAKEKRAEKAAAKQAKVEMGKDGIKVTSATGNYSLRVRGYAQADTRWFLNNESPPVDTFAIRRARPIFEGTAGNFAFRLMPDFAGSSATLFDAYVEYLPSPLFNLRAGKFKPPVSLERLRSATDLTFVERSLPTLLAPNRDLGLMAFGTPLPGLTWEIGIFNGVEDLGNSVTDTDSHKDVNARIFAHPFSETKSMLAGLGIGLAGTWGKREGDLTNRQVGDYRSPAQERVFRYRATTHADGTHWRLAPQGYFYSGPFGLQAEYTISSQEVRNAAGMATLQHSAWEVQARYVLTGETAGNRGWPVAAEPFNPWIGDWGAWEIAARYGQLKVDDDAFPVFADPAQSIRGADNYGFAVHAYLSDNVRLTLDYEAFPFEGGAANGEDRETEQVVFTRIDWKF
jgi:phosphate-selective porin OprO/OprP